MSSVAIYIEGADFGSVAKTVRESIEREYRSEAPLREVIEIREKLANKGDPIVATHTPPKLNQFLVTLRLLPQKDWTRHSDGHFKWYFERFKKWRVTADEYPDMWTAGLRNPFDRGFDALLGEADVKDEKIDFGTIACSIAFREVKADGLKKWSFLQHYEGFSHADWPLEGYDRKAKVWKYQLILLLLRKYLTTRLGHSQRTVPAPSGSYMVLIDQSLKGHPTYEEIREFLANRGDEDLKNILFHEGEDLSKPNSTGRVETSGLPQFEQFRGKQISELLKDEKIKKVVVLKESAYKDVKPAIEGLFPKKKSFFTPNATRPLGSVSFVRISKDHSPVAIESGSVKCPENVFALWDSICEARALLK